MMNTWLARSLTPVPLPKAAPLPKPTGFISDVCAGLCRGGQKSLPPKYRDVLQQSNIPNPDRSEA